MINAEAKYPTLTNDVPQSTEFPVWVGGLQKWVTGVNKRTTCDDIVKALLRASNKGQPADERDVRHYALVEKWRKMERPLDGRARILKVWRSWGTLDPEGGLEGGEVKLLLRRLHPPTPREVKTLHRAGGTRRGTSPWRRSPKLRTVHPRRLLRDDDHVTETVERLMRLIVAQGETIQAQLKRLRDKDDQIDLIEQQRHKARMRQMGANYLIDTYLGENGEQVENPQSTIRPKETQEQKQRTKVTREQVSTKTDPEVTVQKLSEKEQGSLRLYEQLLEVYRRLNAEEEKINRLTAALQQEWHHRYTMSTANSEEVNTEVNNIKTEVESVAALNASLELEIAENERTLNERQLLIGDKEQYIARLTADVEALENDENNIQEQKIRIKETSLACSPGSSGDDSGIQNDYHVAVVHSEKDKESNDTDSNSDTGLSSLHSSSDDGAYVLNTLV